MNCCKKRCINLITLIMVIITFIQINILTIMLFNLKGDNEIISQHSKEEVNYQTYKTEDKYIVDEEWRLIIPKINVSATIKEGTSEEIINNNIGHFEATSYQDGNVGLIAASAGYTKNYFENLYELEEGDIIIYIIGDIKREYKVTTNVEIKETDWSYLSNTQENKLTLITGILEKPTSRRCIQAVEIK